MFFLNNAAAGLNYKIWSVCEGGISFFSYNKFFESFLFWKDRMKIVPLFINANLFSVLL